MFVWRGGGIVISLYTCFDVFLYVSCVLMSACTCIVCAYALCVYEFPPHVPIKRSRVTRELSLSEALLNRENASLF